MGVQYAAYNELNANVLKPGLRIHIESKVNQVKILLAYMSSLILNLPLFSLARRFSHIHFDVLSLLKEGVNFQVVQGQHLVESRIKIKLIHGYLGVRTGHFSLSLTVLKLLYPPKKL